MPAPSGIPRLLTTRQGFPVLYLHEPGHHLSHMALLGDSGSRDDCPAGSGSTHFLEHLLFKGTADRRPVQVLTELENKGGDLNAFTTKERLVLHASCPSQHSVNALDLLGDMWWHSQWDHKEFLKEQRVIREEIGMYQDNPDESLLEAFEKLLFGTHPLSHPILGNEETLSALTSEQVGRYYRHHFLAKPAVLAYHGPLEAPELIQALERRIPKKPKAKLSGTKARGGQGKARVAVASGWERSAPKGLRGQLSYEDQQDFSQAYGMLGGRAPSVRDNSRWTMALLFNWLGGDQMSARLSMELREKHALVYDIEAHYTAFSDTGMWCIQCSCDPANRRKVVSKIHAILSKPKLRYPREQSLAVAKEQLIGRLLLAEENRLQNLIAWGQAYLDGNRLRTLPEIIDRIHQIPVAALEDLSLRLFEKGARRELWWWN